MAQPVVTAQPGVVAPNGVYVVGASHDATCPRAVDLERGIPAEAGLPQDIRNAFVRKVYTLLTLMLIITTVVAFPFQLLTINQIADNFRLIQALMWGSLIVTLAMACCCLQLMRQYPTNYIFLLVFSVLYGIIVGTVSMFYTLPSVLMAAGITAAIFFLLTAYACLTKTDFTGLGPYLVAAVFGLIVFGFVAWIVSFFCASCGSIMQVVYAGIGAILFSMFIVYDTQMIVGGKHKKHQFSVDDFAFAALNLYLDIINLFLMILSLFGGRK